MNDAVERLTVLLYALDEDISVGSAQLAIDGWRIAEHQGDCPLTANPASYTCPKCAYESYREKAITICDALRPGNELPGGLVVADGAMVRRLLSKFSRVELVLSDIGWAQALRHEAAMLAAAKEEG